MSRPQNELDADESSGVTTLLPVANKPARLFEISESDSTSYFSASELLERGKELAARTPRSESSAPPAVIAIPIPEPEPEPKTLPRNRGPLAQVRRTSFARKAIAVLLPLTCVLLLGKPLFERPKSVALDKPSATAPTPSAPTSAMLPQNAAPSAATTAITLPRGLTAAHAAADSVATGDFSRARDLYRELARREPQNLAYREAARILGERVATRSP